MNYQTFLNYMIRYRSRLESKGVHEIKAKGIIINTLDYLELQEDNEFIRAQDEAGITFWGMEFYRNETIPKGKILPLSILDEELADEQDRNEERRTQFNLGDPIYYSSPLSYTFQTSTFANT